MAILYFIFLSRNILVQYFFGNGVNVHVIMEGAVDVNLLLDKNFIISQSKQLT